MGLHLYSFPGPANAPYITRSLNSTSSELQISYFPLYLCLFHLYSKLCLIWECS